jgi:hypothetical protein
LDFRYCSIIFWRLSRPISLDIVSIQRLTSVLPPICRELSALGGIERQWETLEVLGVVENGCLLMPKSNIRSS